MRKRQFTRTAITSLLVVVLTASMAFGGTTGKITGKISDDQGNSLPGANVVLEGTRLGGVADAEGNYLILKQVSIH